MRTLRFGVAYPDPPFNGMGEDRRGLDVDLIGAIASALGSTATPIAYAGTDFNGIFDGLAAAEYDCVISGTTVTPARERRATFAPPYVISGQSLAVDVERFPQVTSVDDLVGLTIGVQQGNTSQPIADRLVADGRAGAVRVYEYGGIRAALSDLSTGGCDAFIKLAPVLTELVRTFRDVEVVQRGLSREAIAIAVAPGNGALSSRITAAQAELEADGTLQDMRRKWLGNAYRDQSLAPR